MTDKVEVAEKLNIYQKLQKSRVDLHKRELKRTGKNTYSNYTYFELSDFLPSINEICHENRLATIFKYSNEIASLTVIDVDNVDQVITFNTPVAVPTLKGCSVIQNIGGAQSFARRYLYMMAFEVSENDIVNNGVDPEEEMRNQKISAAKKVIIRKLIEETESNEEKYLKVVGFKTVEDITEGAFMECLKHLNEKKAKMENKKQPEKEYEAVFN